MSEKQFITQVKQSLSFRAWAVEQHRGTNHKYDKIIPYEYHLTMVAKEVVRHLKIGEGKASLLGLSPIIGSEILIDAAYGHDLIEDCRCTFNDIRESGAMVEVAEIVYALTDDKGRNRAERGNEEHYKKLVKIPGAAFVKFCDRIANVRYSKFAESSMYTKYKKEHVDFIRKCYIPELETFGLRETLDSLFNVERDW